MGTKTAEKWIAYRRMLRVIGVFFNFCWKCLGDENPDFVGVIHSLTPKSMQRFNEKYRNSSAIYYQSWGASINDSRDDRVMRIFNHFFTNLMEKMMVLYLQNPHNGDIIMGQLRIYPIKTLWIAERKI